MVELIRQSWAGVESRAPEVAQFFYGVLFTISPDTRDLFPANMSVQRSRLLRALVHVVQMVDRTEELLPFLRQLGRDHRKFQVVTGHYDAVGTALLTSLKRYAGKDWTEEVEQAWGTAYSIVATAMRDAAEEVTGPTSWWATVVEHRRAGPDAAVIRVRVEEPLPYSPGNHLSVEIPQRPRLWRYLSPSNAPREDGCIEFQVRAVEGGWVSRAMVNQTRPGDVWQLGPAMGGNLTVDAETTRRQLMIAGGSGISPMRSIIEELSRRSSPPAVDLFFGGRTIADLYDLDRLRALASTRPWLNLTAVAEEVPEGSGIQKGTLAEAVTRRADWSEHEILVSGSPTMIRATVAKLLVAGCQADRIRYDPFTID
nr:globin domain-containing protein [Amycolatopsis antarctica]